LWSDAYRFFIFLAKRRPREKLRGQQSSRVNLIYWWTKQNSMKKELNLDDHVIYTLSFPPSKSRRFYVHLRWEVGVFVYRNFSMIKKTPLWISQLGLLSMQNQLLQTTLRPGLKLQSLYYLMGGGRKTKSEVWGKSPTKYHILRIYTFSTLFILYIFYIINQ